MRNEDFYKFIIYKIFTSKYRDIFALDGSYGLYLTIDSENKRKMGDLDLNELSVLGEEGNKNGNVIVNTDKFIKILNEIFEQDGINISWDRLPSKKVREYNQNSIGSKLIFQSINYGEVSVDVSFIINRSGVIKLTWDTQNWNYSSVLNIKERYVYINTFIKEKLFINKFLSILKITDNLLKIKEDTDISKSLYDMWFIISELPVMNKDVMYEQFSLMHGKDKNHMINMCAKLHDYLKENWGITSKKIDMYVYGASLNKSINGWNMLSTIDDYIKEFAKEGEQNVKKKYK